VRGYHPYMSLFSKIGSRPVAVASLTGMTAIQMTLVTIGNITDFGTNQSFVRHVLSMDTTFKSPHLMWRAVTSPGLADATYLAIISWEALTALIFVTGLVTWLRVLRTPRLAPLATNLATTGWIMQLMLFGVGFIAIGGEWFQMWQSSDWNGLQPALQNFLIASVGLLLTYLPRRPAAHEEDHKSEAVS
jgi:predicted small integral membrane protein